MNTIKGFDGLRALSVIFVILTHLGIYGVAASNGWLSDRVAPIIGGTTGVQIFFVLSGYLITSLLIHEHKATGSISLKGFYIRRAFRILPLYFLCVLLTWFVDVFVWPVASTPSLISCRTRGSACSNNCSTLAVRVARGVLKEVVVLVDVDNESASARGSLSRVTEVTEL